MKNLLLLFALLTTGLPLLAQSIPEASGQVSELSLFIGRFHPLIVHLPIGFILMAFLMEVLSRWPRFRHLGASVSFVLSLGILSAMGAAILGYLLSLSGEYQGSTLDWHLWLGIATVVMASLALLMKAKKWPRTYIMLLIASVICLSFTGHLGGNLTHGSDYLIRYMPDPLRSLGGLPPKPTDQTPLITDLSEAIIFKDVIKPITDAKCESCHNPEKTKGDLRLDTQEGFLNGGKNGPVFIAGQPEASELIKRVKLPADHEDVMPPEGKKPLSQNEIMLLEWWVENEASFDKKVAAANVTPEIQAILDQLVQSGQKSLNPVFKMEIAPATADDIQGLRENGFSAALISSEIPLLQVSYLNSKAPLSKKQLEVLQAHAKQIVWLNLSKAQLDQNLGFGFLTKFDHLTELHLDHTQVKNQDLTFLEQLNWLEYLNLYGTDISDAGLKKLHHLDHLKNLYLWQTNTTENGIKALQEKLPEAHIHATGPKLNIIGPDSAQNASTTN